MKRLILIGAIVVVCVLFVAGGALWAYHEQPQFCAGTCHVMQPYLVSWVWSSELSNAHAAEGVGCLDCHEPTIKEQVQEVVTFVKGNYTIPLEGREFSSGECLKCHEHESWDQIAKLTVDYIINGEPVNPHDYPINSLALEPEAYTDGSEYPDPHDTEAGEPQCSGCHVAHGESLELAACTDCHHDGLFTVACDACHQDERIVFSEQEFPTDMCFRCHDYETAEELVALTEYYTVDGEPMNPHAYPLDPAAPEPDAYLDPAFYELEAPGPHETQSGELACYLCHKNMEETSLDACSECHHDGLYAMGCDLCHQEVDYRERVADATE